MEAIWENIKVSIAYLDISCGHTLWNIWVYNDLTKNRAKLSRVQFRALFGIELPKHYEWEEMESIRKSIEDDWRGLVKITHDDSMETS
tara:strand:+ start:731 stop:994 length:264 start_codon:yes stop_codon:yes gene_type:complete